MDDLAQRWEPTVSETFPSLISFWVTVHGLPLHYWTDQALHAIGSDIGHVEAKDATNGRFRVSINGLQPLDRTLELSLSSSGVKEVELEYEKLEKHCFSCLSLSLTKVMTVLQLRLPTLNAQPPWVSTKSGRWKN